ncbi:Putative peptidoglycan binding domain-containing protein [Caldanaerobius fijiensis DSM 17918]|uniref:Putative peptidoglycan binding domain-containing protein n=1 Tax=Caldanaerobius fijiensis DSM 17918 TaxID=1121256 RepID=A0A1M5C3A7_9THEO|nr:Putative peptidoglycan binding domain-containing protein [Caldanaerobius fijiensis DSM 17918]
MLNTKKIVASALIAYTLLQTPSVFAAGILRYGSTGQAVVKLQRELQNLGYLKGSVDGVFGPLTLDAVKKFQSNNGLPVDGIVGPMTYQRIESLLNGRNSLSSSGSVDRTSLETPEYGTTLKKGSRGDAVKMLQENLNRLGYSTGGIDGVFGPATERAVKAFQAKYNLPVNGIAGPQTISAIKRALSTSAVVVSRGLYERAAVNTSIVDIAKQYLGTPYVYGGTTPSGFDCSGFVQYVFKQAGISIGRTAVDQYEGGTYVSSDKLLPGDILFFSTSGNGPTHEGIYIGNNQLIHMSSSQQKATISDFSGWFRQYYIGARRY